MPNFKTDPIANSEFGHVATVNDAVSASAGTTDDAFGDFNGVSTNAAASSSADAFGDFSEVMDPSSNVPHAAPQTSSGIADDQISQTNIPTTSAETFGDFAEVEGHRPDFTTQSQEPFRDFAYVQEQQVDVTSATPEASEAVNGVPHTLAATDSVGADDALESSTNNPVDSVQTAFPEPSLEGKSERAPTLESDDLTIEAATDPIQSGVETEKKSSLIDDMLGAALRGESIATKKPSARLITPAKVASTTPTTT